jgi:pyruvate/2-oxoglutarate dehydrogenase complex dihydrolipoamide dehydrogenase (E3) component
MLVDMAPRVLGTFTSELSEAAKRRLENLAVEVRLGHSVDRLDIDGVVVGGERIASKVVIWTAGVAPTRCNLPRRRCHLPKWNHMPSGLWAFGLCPCLFPLQFVSA